MRFSGLKWCIMLGLLCSSSTLFAQKIQSWSSPEYKNLPPFKKFCLVGFHFSNTDDSDLQDWIKAEIREHFNQVENVFIFQPDTDSVDLYNSEYWLAPIKAVPADVVFTYAVSPVYDTKRSKTEKNYHPLLQSPLKTSLWGYFTSKIKLSDNQEDIIHKIKVEVNIYDHKTLNLIWSGTSVPFSAESKLPTIRKLIEKMIFRAVNDQVINDDID